MVVCVLVPTGVHAVPGLQSIRSNRTLLQRRILKAGEARRFSCTNKDDFLFNLLIHSWLEKDRQLRNRVRHETVPKRFQQLGLLYLDVLGGNRWSVSARLAQLSAESRTFVGSRVLAWLRAFGQLRYPKALPGSGLAWHYLAGCVHMAATRYQSAASMFRKAALSCPATTPARRLFRAFAAGMADFAAYVAVCEQPPATNETNIWKRLSGRALFPRLASPDMRGLLAPLFQIGKYEVSAYLNFRRVLSRWPLIQERPAFHSAGLRFADQGTFSYLVSRSNLLAVLNVAGQDVLAASNRTMYFRGDSGRYVSTATYSNFQPAPHHLNVLFGFMLLETSLDVRFRFQIEEKANFQIRWESISALLGARPELVRRRGRQWTVLFLRPGNPFSSSYVRLEMEKDVPEGMEFCSLLKDLSLSLHGIRFRPFAGQSLQERIRKMGTGARVLEFPLARQQLDMAIMQLLQKTETNEKPNKPSSENNSNQQLMLELRRHLEQSNSYTRKQLTRLGKHYAGLGRTRVDGLHLFPSAAHFYAMAYRYDKVQETLEKMFALQEQEDSRPSFHFTLQPGGSPASQYLDALVHRGAYASARRFLAHQEKLAYLVRDRDTRRELNLLRADLEIRSGKWKAALDILRRLKQQYRQHSSPQKKAVLRLYRDLKDFRRGYGSEKHANRVRLSFVPALAGQGRNYCVPIATQFVLRCFGDRSTTQAMIARAMGTKQTGTSFHRIIRYLRSKGVKPVPFYGTPEKIAAYLRRGFPVWAFIVPPHHGQGHVTAVTGVDLDDKRVYIYEPSGRFVIRSLTFAEMKRDQFQTAGLCFAFVSRGKQGTMPERDQFGSLVLRIIDGLSAQAEPEKLGTMIADGLKRHRDGAYRRHLRHLQLLPLIQAVQDKRVTPQQTARIASILSNNRATPWVDNKVSQYLLGELALAVRNSEDARLAFGRAVQGKDKDFRALIKLADSNFQEGRLDQARKQYRSVLTNAWRLEHLPQLPRYLLFRLMTLALRKADQGEGPALQQAARCLLQIHELLGRDKLNPRAALLIEKAGGRNTLSFLRQLYHRP